MTSKSSKSEKSSKKENLLGSEESQDLDAKVMPVLPLKGDVVIYPGALVPLLIGRPKSIYALEAAMEENQKIFLVAQKKTNEALPKSHQLFKVGTVSTVVQLLKLPDGTIKAVVEGLFRAHAIDFSEHKHYLNAEVELIESINQEKEEAKLLMNTLNKRLEAYVKLSNRIQPEVITSLASIEDPGRFADLLAMNLQGKIHEKQNILEEIDVTKRLEKVMLMLESEIDLLEIERRIQSRVRKQMEKTQRKFYLDEKAKAIQKEMGELDPENPVVNESDALKERIKKTPMSKEAKEKALAEWEKLRLMPPMSSEANIIRVYIDSLLKLPWKKRSKVNYNISKAKAVLDADHYGLESIKERILEYIAVQSRAGSGRSPILCLVGPPGVGKTSLGHSIARATHREFVRIALGGVRDEAEIRGHRRTYIGAMPGKIIQKLTKAKTNNTLFMFDEIDKLGKDFRGDPASALLEVLDPEQNHAFNDHYLEIDYDLSKVMFIGTANSLDMPAALLDRMEIIRLPGYTEYEKLNIAKVYLIPKQKGLNGLKENELKINDAAVLDIIHYYTREAGVRDLDREIAKICRKVVKEVVIEFQKTKHKQVDFKKVITKRRLGKYLGVKRYRYGLAEESPRIGQVCGLAWTEAGGDLLTLEAVVTPGKGKLTYTGRLGGVMQESIQAAMTVVRSRSKRLGLAEDFYQKHDVHVHVPEGAIPKDGPSAGIAVCTALVSAFTGKPVRPDVAMTGEITLRGEVLPIGGLKEKLLAAVRAGIRCVLIPEENKKDLKEVSKTIIKDLDVQTLKWIDTVLEFALVKK